jgi:hypothetical protein
MSKHYICSVSGRFPENYDLGVRVGKWGVEERYRKRIAPVRPGDYIVFVVAGEFRSIHRVTRAPYEDKTLLWPPKDGDIFPYRVEIAPAEVAGRVRVADLAGGISFMRDKVWGGTLQGPNGVFNDRLTPEDVRLVRESFRVLQRPDEEVPAPPPVQPVLQLQGTSWLPGLLDQLADLSELTPEARFPDPFAGAEEWRSGLVSGVYTDRGEVPTLALLPVDRDLQPTVLSALYGLSSLKQSSPLVRGIIFVPDRRSTIGSLLNGLPNLTSVPFDLHVSIRS